MHSMTDVRLINQQLDHTQIKTPNALVGWLGAVQSQEYAGAKWSLAMRLQGVSDAELDQAFAEGSILRTHIMRPTWHFVTPQDIRWMLELTAPHVQALSQYMYRQLELDDALLNRGSEAIAQALQGGRQLTRAELAKVLEKVGIVAQGMRLGYIAYYAELQGMICSGGRRGKQFTYALLEERAPQAIRLGRDEALAELTKRYFTSHGLATVNDFAWWSGLSKTSAKAGVALLGDQLASETIDGQSYWFSPSTTYNTAPALRAYLLSTYDEYIIGYTDRTTLIDAPPEERAGMISKLNFDSMIILGGRIVGTWRRTFEKREVVIEIRPLAPFSAEQQMLVDAAAQRYGNFLGMPVVIVSQSGQDMNRRHLRL